MKIAVFMDPINYLKPYKDTTIAFIKASHTLGIECVYFTCDTLYCENNIAYAQMYDIKLHNLHHKNWATTKSCGVKPLHHYEIILIRKDPPFNMEYIYATYIIEQAKFKGSLVVNDPQSLRDANEKFSILNFANCIPETLVTKNKQRLHEFWQQHTDVIFKPLDGMGGSGIFYVGKDGTNIFVILESLTQNFTKVIMAQRYIPDVKLMGDKRIILINGKPIDYALARMPKSGEIRGNLAVGGKGEVVPLTARDYFICNTLGPALKKRGIYFAGIDVIGDYLTEINITSPTCLVEIEEVTGMKIAEGFLQTLMGLCG